MVQIIELLNFVVHQAIELWSRPDTLATLTGLLVALAITVVIRRHRLRPMAAGAGTDGAYAFFYISGLYSILIGSRLYGAMNHLVATHAPWLQIGTRVHLPVIAHFVILTIALDFIAYWWHRAAHAVPLLWHFHQIHHSQKELTPLTNFRFHIVDVVLRSLMMMLPVFLLGSSTEIWLTVILVQTALDGLAHADLAWTYGPLGFFFVSPQFHRFHHSADSAHFGRNFGQQYSVWDYLFGTALVQDGAPAAYGVPDEVPAGFFRQLFGPFVTLVRRRRPPRVEVIVSEAAAR